MNNNNYENQRVRALQRKLDVIEELGGECQICGYSKNLAALDFHHKDPKEKEFKLDARKLANTSLFKLKLEMNKCILICANCHRELHNPTLEFEIVRGMEKTKSSFSKPLGSNCTNCGKNFPKETGKLYCSKECRERYKNYPSKQSILEKYNEVHSWEKVANFYKLTRKILVNIRKNTQ